MFFYVLVAAAMWARVDAIRFIAVLFVGFWGTLITNVAQLAPAELTRAFSEVGPAVGALVAAWIGVLGMELLDGLNVIARPLGAAAPTGVFAVMIVLDLAAAVFFGYLAVMVRRGIRRLAGQS